MRRVLAAAGMIAIAAAGAACGSGASHQQASQPTQPSQPAFVDCRTAVQEWTYWAVDRLRAGWTEDQLTTYVTGQFQAVRLSQQITPVPQTVGAAVVGIASNIVNGIQLSGVPSEIRGTCVSLEAVSEFPAAPSGPTTPPQNTAHSPVTCPDGSSAQYQYECPNPGSPTTTTAPIRTNPDPNPPKPAVTAPPPYPGAHNYCPGPAETPECYDPSFNGG